MFQAQRRDFRACLGKPFTHESYLTHLTALRDQLKAGLSGAPPEPGTEPRPGVSELAEQIKALKAAYAIEATPERVGKRRAAGEEPVTARIRRRTDTIPPADPSNPPTPPLSSAKAPEPAAETAIPGEPTLASETPLPPDSGFDDSALTHASNHRDRVFRRRRKSLQPTLF